mmetsp:Transcript_6294/g.14605  ORF Transcript_6294/g.14605 Transcript_6294/m.14605 type:complete len:83 (+) Transcript_6294:102-350(+)
MPANVASYAAWATLLRAKSAHLPPTVNAGLNSRPRVGFIPYLLALLRAKPRLPPAANRSTRALKSVLRTARTIPRRLAAALT